LSIGSGAYLLGIARSLARQTKIEYLAYIVMLGFFSAVVFHYIVTYYYQGVYPKDTFILKIVGGHFGDFLVSLLTDYSLDPFHSKILRGEYFPFAYVLIYPFTWLHPNMALCIYNAFFILGMYIFISYYLGNSFSSTAECVANWKNCFILSFMTFPVLFSFERGNLEALLFIFTALSLYFYQKYNRIAAVVFLAVASAMKCYSLLFILLFITDKRYVEAIGTVCLALLLSFGSLFILAPNWHQNLLSIQDSVSGLTNNCVYLPDNVTNCIQYSISLWAPLKLFYLQNLSKALTI